MTWFFRVSHPCMTPDGEGRPSRPAHEDLLENEKTEDDHAIDLLPICQRIIHLGREALDDGVVHEGGPDAIVVVERMIVKVDRAAHYRMQRMVWGVRIRHTQ